MATEVEAKPHAAGTRTAGESGQRTRVAVWAPDPITLVGLTETLVSSLDVFVGSTDQPSDVDVWVFATDRVTSDVVARMRRTAAGSTAPAVLVTRELERAHLMSVVECRVVAVVHLTAATEERLVSTIAAAAAGGGSLPPNLLGELLRQVQTLQQEVLAPRGLNSAGFTPREICWRLCTRPGLADSSSSSRSSVGVSRTGSPSLATSSAARSMDSRVALQVGLRAGGAPEHGAQARFEHPGPHRLDHVVVGARFQPGHHVDVVPARGQHDHREFAARADSPAHLEAVHPGQHQVEDHDVRGIGPQLVEPRFAGFHAVDLVPLLGQAQFETAADGGIILDQQHA